MFKLDPSEYDIVVKIKGEGDVAIARRMAKQFAENAGFSLADVTKIATAVSELSRNIYRYAGSGEVYMRRKEANGVPVVEIAAADRGPGIEDVSLVMIRGYTSSKKSLGLGLCGVRRLMDRFEITTEKGQGTLVVVEKRRRKF